MAVQKKIPEGELELSVFVDLGNGESSQYQLKDLAEKRIFEEYFDLIQRFEKDLNDKAEELTRAIKSRLEKKGYEDPCIKLLGGCFVERGLVIHRKY